MDINTLYGIIMAGFLTYLLIGFVIWILTVIAMWRLFTKAGQPGWKSIIPFYSVYILYKIVWKNGSTVFWIQLLLAAVLCGVSAAGGTALWAALIELVIMIAMLVIQIKVMIRESHAYGHGGGFAVGLFFLNIIFILILGLGSSQYQGPQD